MIAIKPKLASVYDTIIVPLDGDTHAPSELKNWLEPDLMESIEALKASKPSVIKNAGISSFSLIDNGRVLNLVLFTLGQTDNLRPTFLQFAQAFRACRPFGGGSVAVLLAHLGEGLLGLDLFHKIFELPYLVNYDFGYYKTQPKIGQLDNVDFILNSRQVSAVSGMKENAIICAESALLARDLVNHPSCFMTPRRIAQIAIETCDKCGIEIEVLDKAALESLGMKALLAVGAGSRNPPELVVMRYRGATAESQTIALVGKGVMFDSGGYSLKQKQSMATMHGDMGGAAAVIGAMQAVATARLNVNVTAIIPLCENKIGPDSYVPGDVIGTMMGRTVEVVSTDGEGRLILADAITYAIQEESISSIVDIATLTGAARIAVGPRTAVVLTNRDELWQAVLGASKLSCEKVWRLDLDQELKTVFRSTYADTKNTPSGDKAGGAILGALFISEFVRDLPWLHIDISPVSWVTDDLPYVPKGASGYGVSLLFHYFRAAAQE